MDQGEELVWQLLLQLYQGEEMVWQLQLQLVLSEKKTIFSWFCLEKGDRKVQIPTLRRGLLKPPVDGF